MSELQIRNNLGTVWTSLNWKEGFIAVDGEKHWEEGRSAERLANDFSSKVPSSGECSLRDILMSFLHEDKIIWKKATIEHGSQFDSYARPRMQDLAIWGNAGNKAFFIGVEAKVDEPFGSKNIGEQKKYINRIQMLIKGFMNYVKISLADLKIIGLTHYVTSYCIIWRVPSGKMLTI